jgi:hypothetical protein
MAQSITLDHILQLVYGELDSKMVHSVMEAMEADPALLRYYHDCIATRTMLDSIKEEPSPTSIAIIAEHSHDSHTEAV